MEAAEGILMKQSWPDRVKIQMIFMALGLKSVFKNDMAP